MILEKKLLRIKAKGIRNNLDSKKISDKIVNQILSWSKFQDARNIMLYYPIKNEISLLALTKCTNKKFYLPKIEDDNICVAEFNKSVELKKGKYNINEPCLANNDIIPDLDIVFIPALMADEWGYRIGYGKGYYDKFLSKLSAKTIKVIPVYNELLTEELPIELHDEKADFVILENRILTTKILI